MAIYPVNPPTLTGQVLGAYREDLVQQATQEAATYFGTECVRICLSMEVAESEYLFDSLVTPIRTIYGANYSAETYHMPDRRCPLCGEEF